MSPKKSFVPRHLAIALTLVAAGAMAAAGPPGRAGNERSGEPSSHEAGDRMAQRRPQGPPPPLHVILEHHAEELGIDDATLDRIRGIAEDVRDEMDARHDAVRAAHEALRALGESPDADAAQVEAAARQLGDAEAAMAVLHVTTAQRMFALLTPEQREALRELAPPPPEGREGRAREPMTR